MNAGIDVPAANGMADSLDNTVKRAMKATQTAEKRCPDDL
jgi:hypothetical protein